MPRRFSVLFFFTFFLSFHCNCSNVYYLTASEVNGRHPLTHLAKPPLCDTDGRRFSFSSINLLIDLPCGLDPRPAWLNRSISSSYQGANRSTAGRWAKNLSIVATQKESKAKDEGWRGEGPAAPSRPRQRRKKKITLFKINSSFLIKNPQPFQAIVVGFLNFYFLPSGLDNLQWTGLSGVDGGRLECFLSSGGNHKVMFPVCTVSSAPAMWPGWRSQPSTSQIMTSVPLTDGLSVGVHVFVHVQTPKHTEQSCRRHRCCESSESFASQIARCHKTCLLFSKMNLSVFFLFFGLLVLQRKHPGG